MCFCSVSNYSCLIHTIDKVEDFVLEICASFCVLHFRMPRHLIILRAGSRAGTGGGGGAQGACASLKRFERTKNALFVQTNVAANSNLTSKVPIVFSKRIYVYPLTQASYVVLIVF